MENISDSQYPPTKLRLRLNGEASEAQSSMAGMYSLQSYLVNGFPYWKHDSSDKAIWMYGGWYVGDDVDIGTGIAGIIGPDGIEEWPNNISSKWEFSGGGKFQEAKSGDINFFKNRSPKGT